MIWERLTRKFKDWKPIHLCWLFNRMGWKIPKYLIGADYWRDPTGASGTGWNEAYKVYDNSLATGAWNWVDAGQWSEFLEITIGAINCNKVRFYAKYSSIKQDSIDLDAYWSGGWHHIYEGAYTDRAWVEKSLGGTYSVTKVQVRFHNVLEPEENLLIYELDFNQVAPGQVTGVSATDGTHTDKVRVTWNAVSGATKYYVWNGSSWVDVGLVTTWDHTGAPAPTITPGTASASDGEHTEHVALSLSGQSANNGSSISYKVKAWNPAGYGPESASNSGYRGVGALTYQWQRSAGDSDADYSNIDGATTASYNDTEAPADGSGRYYRCVENATGAAQQISTSDRGYRLVQFEYVGTGSLTYSGSGSYYYEAPDWEYAGSGNFVFSGTGIYSIGFAFMGSGSLTYSGEATQIHSHYYLYTGSGELTYSGDAIISIGFTYIGSGTYNFSGVGLYSLGLFYVGIGTYNFSGVGLYSLGLFYVGIGLFSYLGDAVCRYTVFWSKVTREISDCTKVEKEKDDWTLVNKEKGDWDKKDKE